MRSGVAAMLGLAVALCGGKATGEGFELSKKVDPALFAEPPKENRQHAWLTYNLTRATEENMAAQVAKWAADDLTGGFYLGLSGGNTAGLSPEYLAGSNRQPSDQGIAFLSEEYFALYAKIIEMGIKNGNPPIVFYDEVGYPSGMAGGYLYSKYPQYGAKSLEKVEQVVAGPGRIALEIPDGILMGATAMNLDTHELLDISDKIGADRKLAWDAPAGRWRAMGFYLDPKASLGQGNKSGYVDYLDAEAVKAFIDVCYQPHYDHLKQYFGNPLKITQYDEPALHMANGKTWTPKFNAEFKKAYGYDPMKYYPALWYDIGPETAAARNALWGFRSKLWSESYIKQMDDWCRAHGIIYSGHVDQEEVSNPVGVAGDMMLTFKHQEAPGIDDIWWWGRTNRAYKIIQSAAYNWDHPIYLAETYAAYRVMDDAIVHKVAMDQAAMGANFQVGALPRAKTPASDRFIGRLGYMLQHGRHVADIAVLYPIASLQAAYRFGDFAAGQTGGSDVGYAREGGYNPPETDYVELGEMIFRGARRDFTFLHPEVLEGKTKIEGKRLVLDNAVNREEYQALVIPGSRVVSVATANKIKDFWLAGGTVIATKLIPSQATEIGKDREVKAIMDEVFGMPEDGPMLAQFQRRTDEFMVHFTRESPGGGMAYFLPDYTQPMLQAILEEGVAQPDVVVGEAPWPVIIGQDYKGSLTFIHKVKDGRNIYLFANSSDNSVDARVAFKGSMDVSLWDPMTGKTAPAEETHEAVEGGWSRTNVALKLAPATAVFYVEEK